MTTLFGRCPLALKGWMAGFGLTFGALLLCTGGPAFGADAQAQVSITNFVAGGMCGPTDSLRFCSQKPDIELTDDGDCVFNGVQEKCTWYGYAFDYVVDGAESVELQCEFSSTKAYDSGNPNALLGRQQFTSAYTLHLDGGAHHFVNPQYSSGGPNDGKVDKFDEACSYAGKRLFSVEFNMHHPGSVT